MITNNQYNFADKKGHPVFQYEIYNKCKLIQERLRHSNDATTKEFTYM